MSYKKINFEPLKYNLTNNNKMKGNPKSVMLKHKTSTFETISELPHYQQKVISFVSGPGATYKAKEYKN